MSTIAAVAESDATVETIVTELSALAINDGRDVDNDLRLDGKCFNTVA